jgi:hypothetical protein
MRPPHSLSWQSCSCAAGTAPRGWDAGAELQHILRPLVGLEPGAPFPSLLFLDKNRRGIGESQSKHATQVTALACEGMTTAGSSGSSRPTTHACSCVHLYGEERPRFTLHECAATQLWCRTLVFRRMPLNSGDRAAIPRYDSRPQRPYAEVLLKPRSRRVQTEAEQQQHAEQGANDIDALQQYNDIAVLCLFALSGLEIDAKVKVTAHGGLPSSLVRVLTIMGLIIIRTD